jgi:hypothetical protein
MVDMKKIKYPLLLLLCFSCRSFAYGNGIMFHCQINKEWVDLFFDASRVAHYVHSKNGVIDLSLDNGDDINIFKFSFRGLSGGGETHIKFSNHSYDYYLYDITAHSGEDYTFKSGVAVLKDGVVLSNKECINDATILRDAYEGLPRFEQDHISFIQDKAIIFY